MNFLDRLNVFLIEAAATPKWWAALTKEQQEAYIKMHKGTKLKVVPHKPFRDLKLTREQHTTWLKERGKLDKLGGIAFKNDVDKWAKTNGFKLEIDNRKDTGASWQIKRLTNEKLGIILEVVKFPKSNYLTGHTKFKSNEGHWLSFDRTGVEDSFNFDPTSHREGEPFHLGDILTKQIKRVEDYREKSKANTEVLNFGPRSIKTTPENKNKIINLLKTGKSHSLMPSGFGTGFIFSTKRFNNSKPASKEISDLVGKPVFYTEHDMD